MRRYRRLLNILYKDYITNDEVHRKIQAAIGEYDELLTLVNNMKTKMVWPRLKVFWITLTILQGTAKGKRRRGRQKKRWEDNIKECTGIDFGSSTRKGIVANSSVVLRRPSKVMG